MITTKDRSLYIWIIAEDIVDIWQLHTLLRVASPPQVTTHTKESRERLLASFPSRCDGDAAGRAYIVSLFLYRRAKASTLVVARVTVSDSPPS